MEKWIGPAVILGLGYLILSRPSPAPAPAINPSTGQPFSQVAGQAVALANSAANFFQTVFGGHAPAASSSTGATDSSGNPIPPPTSA